MGVVLMASTARAQAPAEAQQVTQAELAQQIVNVTGLARFLSSPATEQELFAVLLANGISPLNGWNTADPVTRQTLARVTVQAMGLADEVANPDDPEAWLAYLREIGVPIDTVGQALDNIGPITDPIAGYVFAAGLTTDPLRKLHVFGEPDEPQFGVDVQSLNPGMTAQAAPPRPPAPAPVPPPPSRRPSEPVIPPPAPPTPPPPPVTPDGGEGDSSGVGNLILQRIIEGILDNIRNPDPEITVD